MLEEQARQKNRRRLIALYLLAVTCYSLLAQEANGDAEAYFSVILRDWRMGDYLTARYQGWTSRLLIEAVITVLARSGTDALLWRLVNIGMYALLLFSLMRLTHHRADEAVTGLLLLYPVLRFASAGWMTTYIFYLWPLALGAFALTSLDSLYHGQRVRPATAALCLVCELFAANLEIVAALYTGLLLWFLLRMALEHRRLSAYGTGLVLLQGAVSAGNLVFAMTCPGNRLRTLQEAADWMPEFTQMTAAEKLLKGVNATFGELTEVNPLFFCFALLLFWAVWCAPRRTPLQTAAAGLPLLTVVLRTAVRPLAMRFFPVLNAHLDAVLTADPYAEAYFPFHCAPFDAVRPEETFVGYYPDPYVPCLIYLALLFAVVGTLLYAFGPRGEGGHLAVVFCAGVASRVVMGFSPTLYASGTRTFIFLDFALIYCIARILAQRGEALRAHRAYRYAVPCFWAAAAVSVAENLAAVCTVIP